MSTFFIHLVIGLLAGGCFGVQTLVTLALAVLIEAVLSGAMRGAAAGAGSLLVGEMALQVGYLGGIYLRSLLERVGAVGAVKPRRQS